MKINPISSQTFKGAKKSYNINEEFNKATKIVEENPGAFKNPQTLEFISNKLASNPYYTPSEYINNFIYFKELETADGESWILNQPEAVSNISADLLLNIDPHSLDASYLELIIELIEDGYLNPSAMTFVKDGFTFNEHLKEDLDLYCDVVSKNEGGGSLLHELNDAYIPTVKSKQEGIKTRKTGDAFQVEGENFIRIKTSKKDSELMHLTKDGYSRLFPLFDRFATAQGELSDCYILETLQMLYSNPSQRVNLIRLFSEDKKGNFCVDINGIKTKFHGTKLPKSEIEENYPIGAPAFSLLEYSYGNYLQETFFDFVRDLYKGDKEKLESFKKFIKENKNNTFISLSKNQNGEYIPTITTLDDAKERGLIKELNLLTDELNIGSFANSSIEFLIGNGGKPFEIQDALGFKITNVHNKFSNEKLTKALLNSKKFMDNHFVTATINNHLHGIELIEDKNGNMAHYLYNPRNQSVPQITNADEILNTDGVQIVFSKAD